MKKKIVVLGSANIDHIAKVEKIPAPGETIGDGVYSKAFGGKGFNQAVAATKSGGDVTFLAAVGDDSDGKQIIGTLANDGADTKNVSYIPDFPTGTAFIFVDTKGENSIVVSPGANKEMTLADIKSWESLIAESDFLVMQMEVPYECVQAAAEIASKNNTFVLLNPAPACKLSNDLIGNVDLLVVNEIESETISGESMSEIGIGAMASKLVEMGAKSVIITLGSKGSYLLKGESGTEFSAFKVTAVDSTAAGDTYCGSLVAYLSEGAEDLAGAIKFASAASALSVQKLGAYPSVPEKDEVVSFLGKN
jgi:ribokinase